MWDTIISTVGFSDVVGLAVLAAALIYATVQGSRRSSQRGLVQRSTLTLSVHAIFGDQLQRGLRTVALHTVSCVRSTVFLSV